MKKVCVIGLGYIGLPTSIIAAEYDFEVVGVDVNEERVRRINSHDPIIEEPELKTKLSNVLRHKQFKAVTNVESADYFVIAVPTPFKGQKKADLSYVDQAVSALCLVLQKGATIILESTVPVGTTETIAQTIQQLTGFEVGIDYALAHCPERVLPGNIFHELVYNTRIIGGITQQCVQKAALFYKEFVKARLYLTNANAAEMVKLVENSSRDAAIAFANQVAAMAYKKGLNPFEIIELANKHPRVNILNPSCGVGGHCIAVDPWFLIETFPEQTALLRTVREINDAKPHQIVQAIKHCMNEWQKSNNGTAGTVLILGLTYKPDIDDVRESPALIIAKEIMHEAKETTLICEPHIHHDELNTIFGKEGVTLQDGLEQADIVVCLVKHKQFRHIDKSIVDRKKVLDYCGLFYDHFIDNDYQQEHVFWPASVAAIKPIIDHVQKET